ncbi:MAG: NAD(P)/FAD-dependent oxidoreductase [Actinobacteria bacterium]|nr:NAD(P)/FAD-dependent oxidoreductase [Actinomycetota bacterium]
MENYVIIGNSVAAIAAIEAIRKKDKEGSITVVSDEPYLAYSRPLISYYIEGKVDEDRMLYRPRGFYEKKNVKTILGEKAVKVDSKTKKISLKNGQEISYTKLLVATGGLPFFPPMKGIESDGVFVFRTLDDAKKILEYSENTKRAVMIGGGFISLKAAHALRELGLEITVVELLDRIMGIALDNQGAEIVEKRLEENGIEILTKHTVSEIVSNKRGKVEAVILDDGKRIDCEMVIVAVGVRPNFKLLDGSGVKTNRGIVVNDKMETNVSNIYAAGDVAEAYDFLYKENRLNPIWPNAYEQGFVAGTNMAGGSRKYPGGMGMNSVEFYGIPSISMGITSPEEEGYEVLIKHLPDKNIYKKLVLKDNVIIGAIFVGDIDRAGIVNGLIKEQAVVRDYKADILEDSFGFVSFPIDVRKEKLTKSKSKAS